MLQLNHLFFNEGKGDATEEVTTISM